jgi:hypothetical protein
VICSKSVRAAVAIALMAASFAAMPGATPRAVGATANTLEIANTSTYTAQIELTQSPRRFVYNVPTDRQFHSFHTPPGTFRVSARVTCCAGNYIFRLGPADVTIREGAIATILITEKSTGMGVDWKITSAP